MRIISWNINSLRIRLNLLEELIQTYDPDVLCLQEIKCENKQFPYSALEHLPYNLLVLGQKSYNGVAIFSKQSFDNTSYNFGATELTQTTFADYFDATPTKEDNTPSRVIDTYTYSPSQKALRIVNIYAPNGNPLGTDKYTQKINFYEQLIELATQSQQDLTPMLIIGDFNIIPELIDVANPDAFKEDALFTIQVRQYYQRLVQLGFNDSFRLFNPNTMAYSFWDYQGGAYKNNQGIRIDYALTNPLLTPYVQQATILSEFRAKEKTSDHAPILLTIDW